ncbi:uncharacterized protein BDW43DRAFT_313555 [Aspergillus alliaceus]|uniref:uncharacterized protein n=1 Tax=Petromyces alliaceus TaxID=209559 RepID=UPI0012A75595|nr:uncharacterized protein BDW43DRAFT_313555 [Aspergillus alliaceus]KAB8230984.1 hypothetical protein BDW43DRAFT_313555 [Aspergillus alliaceus]
MREQDRTFIVSGGSSGLGRATAGAFARIGAYVAIFDIAEPADAIVEELPADRVKFYEWNIISTSNVEGSVQDVIEWSNETHAPLGGICCAGMLSPGKIIRSSFEPLALSTIRNAINISLVGTIDLNEGKRGVFIMVSSAAEYDGQPGQVVYSATKGAIRSLTLPLARDLSRYGIRAVSIAPNMFSAAMIAKGKMPEKARQAIERHFVWPRRAGNPD